MVSTPSKVGMKYRAFLSYSHVDSSTAKRLHAELERFRIDDDLVDQHTEMGRVPPNLRPILRDREEFKAGVPLAVQTDTALGEAMALIVLCSPAAAMSDYVNDEVQFDN